MADARNLRVEETLRDGTRVMIRAARPDDRERIARAFHGLERDSVYTRFFTYKDALTTAELARLDVMDFARDHAAFTPPLHRQAAALEDGERIGVTP